MCEKRETGVSGGIGKIFETVGTAAVVDDDNVVKAGVLKPRNDGSELFIRVVGRDYHRYALGGKRRLG